MVMQNAPQRLEVQQLDFSKVVDIAAPLDITWESVLLELGPESVIDNKPYPFVFEAWPGGRWFRDLGNNTGHLWGHVQDRLTPDADAGTTRMTLTHRAYGLMPTEFMKGVDEGWSSGVKRIAEIAQRIKAERGGKQSSK